MENLNEKEPAGSLAGLADDLEKQEQPEAEPEQQPEVLEPVEPSAFSEMLAGQAVSGMEAGINAVARMKGRIWQVSLPDEMKAEGVAVLAPVIEKNIAEPPEWLAKLMAERMEEIKAGAWFIGAGFEIVRQVRQVKRQEALEREQQKETGGTGGGTGETTGTEERESKPEE